MSTNNQDPVNRAPFLRTTREFPSDDAKKLSTEVNRGYIDIANAVNNRTIGIYPSNKPGLSGESYFITNAKQQGLRQVYNVTSTASIPHGLNFTNIDRFTQCFGAYTNGTDWFGIIFGSSVAITGQLSFYLTPTNIVILSGGGAPALTKGTIVLQWLSVA